MANRLTNLLGNTKTRTMVLLVIGVLIFGVVIAVSQTDSKTKNAAITAPSKTTSVPNQVKSTPGSQISRNYQELQEKDNIRGAQQAAQQGKTFIPTLTGNAQGFNDQDFEKQLTSAYDQLGGKCSSDEVSTLRKQGMNSTQIIMQLKSFGCSAAAIAALFTPDEIAAALLAEKSCSAVTGCTADAVKQLKTQGNDATKIVAALKANGCATNDIVSALKANGSSADEIATALKANGASIDEITTALKANGFDAVQIANALSKAGFAKNDIIAALTKAGFSAVDIAKALSSLNLAQGDNSSLLAQQAATAAAAQRLNAQQEAQQLAAYSQQRQGKIQELVTAMQTEEKTAIDSWAQVPQQLFTQGDWATKKAAADGTTGTSANGKKGSTSQADANTNNKIILKAGSILFAVLDTAVDSDEPGPVMATVVSGALKGSKLLGTMNLNTDSETVSLRFTAINMPNEAKSAGINAVAIDPDTARTALATGVDNHYLYRWGSLFASSFVQGYASAVASSGTTSTTSQGAAGVTTTSSSPAMDPKQQLFAGLAAVGTQWAQAVGQNFQRPITVTIDQGTGVGILVTSDFSYGSAPVFYSPATTTAAAANTPAGGAGAAGAASGGTANVPGALGNTGALTNDQRQALWNILQNQPVTTHTAGSSTVTTTTTMGGAAQP